MNVFNLAASLTLDKKNYEDGLNQAESQANKLGGKIGGIFKALGTATVASLGASTAAVGKLLKDSVTAYAEYEQLVGGVQKLYGTAGMSVEEYAESVGKSVNEVKGKYDELNNAQDLVMKNAAEAYRTTGMSASQYMEQATSFSASLINSLGGDTVKAAEQTDVAMRAIADNYNTFGGDMQMIQGAFQGFAKQNYTMLDNLKLGYGGTKTEMERLIADANEWAEANGKAADLSINSFSDVVTAIDYIQQKQQIAGTTAREASKTIEGSLNATKAAWQNLVTAIASGGDLGQSMNGLLTALFGTGEDDTGLIAQVTNRIQKIMDGVGEFIEEAGPMIAEKLPALIEAVLPPLLTAIGSLAENLAASLPGIFQILLDQIPSILSMFVEQFALILPMFIELLVRLGETLAEALPSVLQALADSIPTVVEKLKETFSGEMGSADTLQAIIDSALNLISALADALIEALPVLIPAIVDIVLTIAEKLTEPKTLLTIINAAVDIALAIVEGLVNAIPRIIEGVANVITNIVSALIAAVPKVLDAAVTLFGQLIKGINSANLSIIAYIPQFILQMLNAFGLAIKQLLEMGKKWVNALKDGIKSLDPAAWGRDLIKNFMNGLKEKWEELKSTVSNIAGSIKDGIKSLDPVAWGRDLIENFISGLKEKWEKLKSTVSNIAGSIKALLGFSEPEKGPLSNFHTYAPDMMDLFMQGINDNKKALQNTVMDAFDFQNLITAPEMKAGDEISSRDGQISGQVTNVWNVTFNQPVNDAIDFAKKMREEEQYGLIGGGNLAY